MLAFLSLELKHLEVFMTKKIQSNQKGETFVNSSHITIPHAKVGELYATIGGIEVRVKKIAGQVVYYVYVGSVASGFGGDTIPTFAVRFPVKGGSHG